ncbi:hypothetical protein SPI_04223 [Niveomyces insectorum RCEF 264]|uniref:Uncharacterized protein n=1 Tax=Niveomyces insectorum RCEF 264 TaxID=1081102 RepID=A0A167VJ68_9HYPO|nr:hypothetical protein SPI_04223 [Niveomyces insectorum RCEF 264]
MNVPPKNRFLSLDKYTTVFWWIFHLPEDKAGMTSEVVEPWQKRQGPLTGLFTGLFQRPDGSQDYEKRDKTFKALKEKYGDFNQGEFKPYRW